MIYYMYDIMIFKKKKNKGLGGEVFVGEHGIL